MTAHLVRKYDFIWLTTYHLTKGKEWVKRTTHALFIDKKCSQAVIKFLTLGKTREEPKLPDEVMVFKFREKVPYPRNEQGNLTAMVHKKLRKILIEKKKY
ncbi:hypothetical protein [Endozoicomonas sp. GU-1]|uniref:hypothetical protein n=1 Tax=Endozoicomonas sp. GU-1 TaxID=3009078 RepID=UPI0022B55588|nr:hypothetical protein [Endozoicomonas sp. GU-1]WBA82776.1 hypothetical protein O2T12_06510 [Endozoicomonas sp. GU-1]WBA85704.1 hypothetical protein O3276_21155 [Endozoicomonas sp. GU-1]